MPVPYGDINVPTRDRFDPTNPQSLRQTLEANYGDQQAQAAPTIPPPQNRAPQQPTNASRAAANGGEVQGPNQETMRVVMAGFLSGDPAIKEASKTYYNSKLPKKRTRYYSTGQGVLDTKTGDFIRDDEFIKEQREHQRALVKEKAAASAAEWIKRTGVKEGNLRSRPKTIPNKMQENLLKGGESVRVLDELLSTEKGGLEEAFSGGVTGWDWFQNKIAARAEFMAPQSWVDQNNWWSLYRKHFEMPEIHKLYGAVLSAGEEARYKQAAVSPEMKDTTIREKLGIQKAMIEEWNRRAVKLASDTYNRPNLRQELDANTPPEKPVLRKNAQGIYERVPQ